MDFRSLRFAITLAEELHFGRAAQRHYIGAQPFGRHIQELERELGVRLFERNSRRVTVTQAGARVLAEAQAILNAVDALTDSRTNGGGPVP
ncbi:LysR family transcriptional regulator [Actinoallomurus sp. CA-150999]|uniref:LysR family transcriptional regulator n=1 Tax=Actinoallomurus sp. CA-150999 TaxID=3239887 RepID=UPI003D9187A3